MTSDLGRAFRPERTTTRAPLTSGKGGAGSGSATSAPTGSVQRRVAASGQDFAAQEASLTPDQAASAGGEGLAGRAEGGPSLPHLDRIQKAFAGHGGDAVQADTGDVAVGSCEAPRGACQDDAPCTDPTGPTGPIGSAEGAETEAAAPAVVEVEDGQAPQQDQTDRPRLPPPVLVGTVGELLERAKARLADDREAQNVAQLCGAARNEMRRGMKAEFDDLKRLIESNRLALRVAGDPIGTSALADDDEESREKINAEAEQLKGSLSLLVKLMNAFPPDADAREQVSRTELWYQGYQRFVLPHRAQQLRDTNGEAGASGRAQAETIIEGAQEVRAAAKSMAVAVVKAGAASLHIPPPLVDVVGAGFEAWLNTADRVVGDKLVLEGNEVSAEAAWKIYLANNIRAAVGVAIGQVKGQIPPGSLPVELAKHVGFAVVGAALDATLERLMITGQREPRLTFTLEEFNQVFAAELRKSMPGVEGDLTVDQTFFNLVRDILIEGLTQAL